MKETLEGMFVYIYIDIIAGTGIAWQAGRREKAEHTQERQGQTGEKKKEKA